MIRTLNDLINDILNDNEIILKDEYIGKEGIPYCKSCKTPRYFVSDDKKYVIRCLCKCQEEARDKKEAEDIVRRRSEALNERYKLSLLGERYKNILFADATITKFNESAFKKCYNYVKSAEIVLENNIGLYIYGENSTGKTFLAACICNELLRKGYRCIYTNIATILNEIHRSFNAGNKGENMLMNRLQFYEFAFIDDLGKDFIGREYNATASKWAEEKLFEVINARYNAQKPIVFTSNYSITDLERVLKLDKAIVERINEMATRVLKLNGDDFRLIRRLNKNDIIKKIGI